MQRDNEELDGVEKRLDAAERRLGGVEVRLGGVEVRVGALEKRVDEGFKEVRGDIARLDEKFDAKFATLDEKFDVKFDRLQTAMLQAVVGVTVSLSMIVAGILLTGLPG